MNKYGNHLPVMTYVIPAALFCALLMFQVKAQPYPIGHRTITFTDAARNNRPVPAEIYYPGQSAGNNTTVVAGAFPVIVFGHGYLMSYSSYFYFRDSIVPDGYILVLPTTAGNLFPNHLDFGKDLAFLVSAMKSEGVNPSSPFYGHIDSTSAIMGHSMGGGASFLACSNNHLPTVMVTFAAAETDPSAIAAASAVTLPALVFSASEDCVTPPASNQVPMYNALAGNCKTYINITGGGHCYFADYNFQCSVGEIGCKQNFTITRDQQHAVTLDFTKPFLDYFLKKDTASWVLFNDSLTASNRIAYQKACNIVMATPDPPSKLCFSVSPNPAHDQLILHTPGSFKTAIETVLSDVSGNIRVKCSFPGSMKQCPIDLNMLPDGFYIVAVYAAGRPTFLKFIKR